MIYWFTGQPGAGKTTLALGICKYFEENQQKYIHIDGDNLRKILCNFNYDEAGRKKNINDVITIARFLDSKNLNTIISVVAPYRLLREDLKKTNKVVEFFVHTKEKRGRENYFVKDYEPPLENFIDINTTNISIEKTLKKIIDNYLPHYSHSDKK